METEQLPTIQTSTILCCMCGIQFTPGVTRSNVCVNCISSTSEVTMGITKESILIQCRNCKRYQRPPWTYCERESKELLTICLKKIKGLNKVKIIDAAFVWTEAHSKRIKVKLTIQKEIFGSVQVQETFVVEFTEYTQQCEDCQKEFTPHTWGSVVQLRQPVEHKKTFFFLEQLILKHNAHDKVLLVKEEPNGLDFFFKNRTQALKLVDFLTLTMPTQLIQSKQLIGTDIQSAKMNYKFTYSLNLPKRACKNDIVILPHKLRVLLGASSEILVCIKIASSIRLLDPITMNIIDLTPEKYFQYEHEMSFANFCNHATEFMVLNSDEDMDYRSHNTSMQTLAHKCVRLEITRTKDWQNFSVRSHLGNIFREGNLFLGWDMTTLNLLTDIQLDNKMPEVILLRKINPNKMESKKRIYKLKRMDIEHIDENDYHKRGKKGKKPTETEKEFEDFMDEIEYDPQSRAQMTLYRDENAIKDIKKQKAEKKSKKKLEKKPRRIVKIKQDDSKMEDSQMTLQTNQDDDEWEDEDEDAVKLEELLFDMKLDDKTEREIEKENENAVDDFISKLEKVKISK